ncbi:MAG: YraN family protein [Clostridia bacterium]|nr:YraN family protein [Clostridia bacterium]
MIKNKTGVRGEIYTSRYLRDNKFEILSTNYISSFGEIDIIARKGDTIHFVEVKARDEDTLTRPADAVDDYKQNRIMLTANNFVTRYKIEGACVFDVSEVYIGKDGSLVKLNYIPNAFEEN